MSKDYIHQAYCFFQTIHKRIQRVFEGVIKLMNEDILIAKEILLVWNVKNVEEQNIVKMDL
jgi:hypothetical protein